MFSVKTGESMVSKTPLLDELKKGPWPGFVQEYEKMAAKKEIARRMLNQLELSYRDKRTYWKHGGAVTVKGYGGGVIGRYSAIPEVGPPAGCHTFRVAQPAAWFYKTDALRTVCDVWEKYGSGLMNLHGSTGDIILLGAPSEVLQQCFDELSSKGFDLGGSGSDIRSLSCCMGPALCEWACFDTLDVYHTLTMEFQDWIHRPAFPYKFKIKISGCPNDCVASLARADFAIIGTWKDEIQIDQEAVREYAKAGMDIKAITERCPTKCMSWDGKELKINNEDCTRCMYCINKMPKALRPGKERGATILLGGKATILQSAMLGWVIVPFMKIEKPYTELIDLIKRIVTWWDENARTRERVAELIYRVGMRVFLKAVGLPPVPQMVFRPRNNPYYFWSPEELEEVK
jgi:sulfite reductase alpha subunit